MPGKALKWPEFFVRNIPNIRLESRVITESQCFRYLHKKGILKVFTTVNQRVAGSSRVSSRGDSSSGVNMSVKPGEAMTIGRAAILLLLTGTTSSGLILAL